jgi:hypothetical protein
MSARRLRPIVIVALLAALAGCAPGPGDPPAPTTPGATGATSPGSGATPSGPTLSEGPIAAGALAVYYVVNDRERLRLVREFHRLPVGDGSPAARTKAAVTEMLGRSAYDPDYRTLWPAGSTVGNVSVNGDVVTVDVRGASVTPGGAEASEQAVAQLVWTATAASGKPAVKILLDGVAGADLWGHVSLRESLRRGPAVDTIALVWLIDPQHGATVGREFTMHLAGSVFEATVNYEIRRGGQVVKEGFATLSEGAPAQGEAKVAITLPPGEYVLEAFEISADDGSRLHIDNHTVTVR